MAVSRIISLSFIVCSVLLLQLTEFETILVESGAVSPAPQIAPIDCGKACEGRCRLSKRPNLCKRSCGSCCVRCKCVPPGTSGNYETCSCYATLTTHNNTRKCP